jgi:hypothetical protein
MNEHENTDKHTQLKQSAMAAGGTALTAGLIDVAMHMGPTGLVVGGIASYLAWRHGPDLIERVKELLPNQVQNGGTPDAGSTENREPGKRTFADRLLGRPAGVPQVTEESDEPALPASVANKIADKRQQGSWIPPQFLLDDALEIVEEFNRQACVYFGDSEDGGVAIELNKMYHVIDVSSSGKGKSNRFRLAMMQMVGNCETYCINPLAANVKPVIDDREIEVWKPIYDRLVNGRPLKDGSEIRDLLSQLVDEIAVRNDLEEQQDFSWSMKPLFVFIDELPEVYARCPEAVKLLDKIGRMGRQYCIFLWIATQTANVNDIGISTAAQAQFKTRVYGGGDKISADRIMKGAVPSNVERILQSNGAGLTLMLADNMSASAFTRSPLVTNEALFTYLRLPPFRKEEWMRKKTMPAAPPQMPVDTRRLAGGTPLDLQAALSMYRPGMTYRQLGAALGYGDSEARTLWTELQKRGMLTRSQNREAPVLPSLPDTPPSVPAIQSEQERAIAIWHELEAKQLANVRDFATAMVISETKAWQLLNQLATAKLIQWDRRRKKALAP